jgi:MFS family permease
MLPWTAVPMVVAPIAGALADRIGGRPIVMSGLLTMAAGLGWFALVNEPDVSYLTQVPAFVLSGIGMAMFFAPSGAILMASVQPAEQGIASGVNNSVREVGGALGVAVLASVFAARGGYETPQMFTDGLVPALWLGVASLLAAAVAMLWVPRRLRSADTPAVRAGDQLAAPVGA